MIKILKTTPESFGCLVGVNNLLKIKNSYDHPTTAYKILLNNHFINPLSVESGYKYRVKTMISPNDFIKKIINKSYSLDILMINL